MTTTRIGRHAVGRSARRGRPEPWRRAGVAEARTRRGTSCHRLLRPPSRWASSAVAVIRSVVAFGRGFVVFSFPAGRQRQDEIRVSPDQGKEQAEDEERREGRDKNCLPEREAKRLVRRRAPSTSLIRQYGHRVPRPPPPPAPVSRCRGHRIRPSRMSLWQTTFICQRRGEGPNGRRLRAQSPSPAVALPWSWCRDGTRSSSEGQSKEESRE